MRSILFIISVFFSLLGFAQTNLIPNGRFNSTSFPPSPSIYSAAPWYNPSVASPDLLFASYVPPPIGWGVPYNIFGTQYAKIDTNYAGICLWIKQPMDTNIIYREYIATPLMDSLQKNKCYNISLYYSLSDGSRVSINRLGILISKVAITSIITTDSQLHNVLPQVYIDTNVVISDTVNWIKLSGIYKATGGEKYLTIGNFFSKSQINKESIKSLYPSYVNYTGDSNYCYVYIDDVSLYEIPKPNLGGDKSVCLQNNALIIGDHTLPNHSLTWYRNDTLLSDTTNLISIHPNYTGTYILQNQGCAADTIVIHVLTNCPTPADPVPNTFTPNDDGINDAWVFSVGSASTKVSCRVYNRWGNLIYQLPNATPPHTTIHWDGRTNSGEKCSEGVYFYTIEYTNADGHQIREKGYVSLFR